jgi:transcription elongation factor
MKMEQGTTLTTASVTGGALRWHGSTLTTLTQDGGFVFDNSEAPPVTHIMNGGLYTFEENTHGTPALNINTMEAYGGSIDFRTRYANVGTSGGTITVHSDEVEWAFDAGRGIGIS